MAKRPITAHCNAGNMTSYKGDDKLGKKTLHMSTPMELQTSRHCTRLQKNHITYDSKDRGGVFRVHTSNEIKKFKPNKKGLHTISMDGKQNVGQMFVNNDQGNYKGFNKQKILEAMEAKRLQMMMGNPSYRDFVGVVQEMLLSNCPLTVSNANTAKIIYSPYLSGVRGETVRERPECFQPSYVSIPKDFMELHKYDPKHTESTLT